MNNILIGALLFFICSTGIFGYISYDLSEQKGMAVQALQDAQDRLLESEKSLKLRDLSCKIDDASLVEAEADKKVLKDKIDTVNDNIEKLRLPLGKPSVAVKQENIKNENLKPNVLPDDGLLSDNIVSLLKQGYCTTYPADSECVSK